MSQRTSLKNQCKNHSEKQAPYFLTDQPWITFCSQCALNVALFGKKISKNHSAQELGLKTNIDSWYNKLLISKSQLIENKKILDTAMNYIEDNILEQIMKTIKDYDEYIEKMIDTRQKLKKNYNDLLQNKLSKFYELQTNQTLNQMNIKKQIAEIQANAQNLIEGKSVTSVTQKLQKWDQLIKTTLEIVITQKQINEIYEQGRQIQSQMKNMFNEINTTRLLFRSNSQNQTKQNSIVLNTSQLISQNSKGRQTRLKLRSTQKNTENKQRKSFSFMRKSLRDSTNVSTLSAFQY